MVKLRNVSLILSCRACGSVFCTKDTRQKLCDECRKYLSRKRLEDKGKGGRKK